MPLYEQTKFLMKSKILIIITSCFTFLLSSCLGDSKFVMDFEVDKNCQITEFSLSTDSVPGLAKVKFTIDQLNGLIMNLDSMPYGTVIDKVICNLKYAPYATSVEVFQEATGDTVKWSKEDSLDFSKPVKFVTSSMDGQTKRIYKAFVNIHKMVPDSMPWNKLTTELLPSAVAEQKTIQIKEGETTYYYMYTQSVSGNGYKLYRASESDVLGFEELALTGLPLNNVKLSQITSLNTIYYVPTVEGQLYSSVNGIDWKVVDSELKVKTVLGSLDESKNQAAVLSTIVEDGNVLKFAAMDQAGQWNIGEVVTEDFPVEGFSALSVNLMYKSRIVIVGGKSVNNQLHNLSWATMDALSWSKQTDTYKNYFSKRQGTSMTYYDNMIYLIGGIDENGAPQKDIYRSLDYGVTWNLADTLIVLPETYQARGNASILVDKDNFMFIFGGKKAEGQHDLNDVWRGRINRLGFIRQ